MKKVITTVCLLVSLMVSVPIRASADYNTYDLDGIVTLLTGQLNNNGGDNAQCKNDALFRTLVEFLLNWDRPVAVEAPEITPTPTPTPVPATPVPQPQAPAEETQEPSDTSPVDEVLEYEAEVVRLVNEIRVQYGLGRLALNVELTQVARAKSQDMHDLRYFDHTSPTYGSPFDMMRSFGIRYRTAGENIAYGYRTPQAVVDGWMNSSGHRANILNASYTQIGVGYVADGNYWTQMFIG